MSDQDYANGAVVRDAKLESRGSADKARYVPNLIKMCQGTGLRECLRPLAPSNKHIERDLDEHKDPAVEGSFKAAEHHTTTTEIAEATPDVDNKKGGGGGGRGGGFRGGRGGGGRGGRGGGGHGSSAAATVAEDWALRVGVVVCLVGWVGFVGLL